MKLAYILNKEVSADKIIKDIQKLVSKIPKDEIVNSVLTISLEKITDYAGDNPIPKITYEGDSLT